jgi:hypothetical protein
VLNTKAAGSVLLVCLARTYVLVLADKVMRCDIRWAHREGTYVRATYTLACVGRRTSGPNVYRDPRKYTVPLVKNGTSIQGVDLGFSFGLVWSWD